MEQVFCVIEKGEIENFRQGSEDSYLLSSIWKIRCSKHINIKPLMLQVDAGVGSISLELCSDGQRTEAQKFTLAQWSHRILIQRSRGLMIRK